MPKPTKSRWHSARIQTARWPGPIASSGRPWGITRSTARSDQGILFAAVRHLGSGAVLMVAWSGREARFQGLGLTYRIG